MTIFAGDKERNLANTVMDWLLNLGYLGLFLGTFLAGTVLPLSSDILLVGMLAAKADPLICLPVAAVGNWLGAMTSYWLGWYAKWEWLEKWFRIKPDTLRRQQERVDKYGVWLAMVFWAPFIGMVCMIALGVYKVPPGRRHSWRWPAPSSGFHSGYCSRPSGSNNPAGCGQTAALHPPRDRPPVPPKEKRQFLVKSENNYYLCEPKGEVQEWLNWPAWKASKPLKGFRGSNPLLSASR